MLIVTKKDLAKLTCSPEESEKDLSRPFEIKKVSCISWKNE
jgi:hypothetical protein